MNKGVIAAVIVLLVVVSAVGYYEYSGYQQAVVQTSVVTGTITSIQAASAGTAGAVPGQAGGGALGQAGGAGVKGPITGSEFVTISIGSVSFTQVLPCTTAPYRDGVTVRVADQLLRSGQHQYVADIACRGGVSPFASLHINQTSSSSTQG